MVYNVKHEIRLAKLDKWQIVGDKPYELPYYSSEMMPDKRGLQKRSVIDARGFTEADMRVLNRARAKITKVLDKVPWKFRLHFFLQPEFLAPRGDLHNLVDTEGPIKTKEAQKMFWAYEEKWDKNWQNSINLIVRGAFFNEAESGHNLPPTAWIIAHWIGHSLLKGYEGRRLLFGEKYEWAFLDLLQNSYFDDDRNMGSLRPRGSWTYDIGKKVLEGMFTFRSARRGEIRNFYEGVHEMFALFLQRGGTLGKVGLPPEKVQLRRKSLTRYDEDDPAAALRQQVDDFKERVEKGFREDLNNAVGKWFMV